MEQSRELSGNLIFRKKKYLFHVSYIMISVMIFSLAFYKDIYAEDISWVSFPIYINNHEISKKKLSSIPYYVNLITEDLQAYHDTSSIFDGYLTENEFELEVGPPIQRVTHDSNGSIYIIMENPITAGSQGKTIELIPYANSNTGSMIFVSLECYTDMTQPEDTDVLSSWNNAAVSALYIPLAQHAAMMIPSMIGFQARVSPILNYNINQYFQSLHYLIYFALAA